MPSASCAWPRCGQTPAAGRPNRPWAPRPCCRSTPSHLRCQSPFGSPLWLRWWPRASARNGCPARRAPARPRCCQPRWLPVAPAAHRCQQRSAPAPPPARPAAARLPGCGPGIRTPRSRQSPPHQNHRRLRGTARRWCPARPDWHTPLLNSQMCRQRLYGGVRCYFFRTKSGSVNPPACGGLRCVGSSCVCPSHAAHRPKIILEMMFFWISLEPPKIDSLR
jgi:hypothetical protein